MLTFFLLLVTTPAADPFVRLAFPPDNGAGPNPLLQNHPLMALHPPLLYLGYVLTSVPFAYAIASLILGEGGDRWLVATRRYALVSWAPCTRSRSPRSVRFCSDISSRSSSSRSVCSSGAQAGFKIADRWAHRSRARRSSSSRTSSSSRRP